MQASNRSGPPWRAWGRTMMALVTVSAIFLRWLPSHGIIHASVDAGITGVLWTASAGMTLGLLGIGIVLAS